MSRSRVRARKVVDGPPMPKRFVTKRAKAEAELPQSCRPRKRRRCDDNDEKKEENKQDDEIEKLKLHIGKLKKQLNDADIEKDSYKLMAASFRDQMYKGGEPRRHIYDVSKTDDDMQRTDKTQTLYDEMMDLYGDILVSGYHNKLNAKSRKLYENFLEINADPQTLKNPLVSLSKTETKPLTECVRKTKITAPYRVDKLIGQYGIFAKRDINANIILGRYVGLEFVENEWQQIFDGSHCGLKHGEYLFSFYVDYKAYENADDSRRITIDPLEGNMHELPLLYMNDIRCNLFESKPTKQDKKLENCQFVLVNVNGWPTPFVVTIKPIHKDEELLIDYGISYSIHSKSSMDWNKMIKETNNMISNNILKDNKLDDLYRLE